VFYEIVAQSKEAARQDPSAMQQFYVQFITRYLHGQDGSQRVRVTTFTRRCPPPLPRGAAPHLAQTSIPVWSVRQVVWR
jgi:hypothetical protein